MWKTRLLKACLVTIIIGAALQPRDPRRRRPISTGPAATMRVRRFPPAIRRIARWCANATGAAAPGASIIRPMPPEARCAGSRAMCRRAPRIIAASPACAAPAWSSSISVRSNRRSTGSAATIAISIWKAAEGDEACKAACTADNKCRAWTYARPGYVGRDAHCYLKKDIKPPRRKPGFISGVVR